MKKLIFLSFSATHISKTFIQNKYVAVLVVDIKAKQVPLYTLFWTVSDWQMCITNWQACKRDWHACKRHWHACKGDWQTCITNRQDFKRDWHPYKTNKHACKGHWQTCKTNWQACKRDWHACKGHWHTCKTNWHAYKGYFVRGWYPYQPLVVFVHCKIWWCTSTFVFMRCKIS